MVESHVSFYLVDSGEKEMSDVFRVAKTLYRRSSLIVFCHCISGVKIFL